MLIFDLKNNFCIFLVLFFGLSSCFSLELKEYPKPSNERIKQGKAIDGVSAIAIPILDEDESEETFGVNLLDKNILAIYLLIQNDNPESSFIVSEKSVHIIERNDEISFNNNPGLDSTEVGKMGTAMGALLLSAPLMGMASKGLSDGTIIQENFKSNQFRTRTINPGDRASGFSYFSWADIKKSKNFHICFELNDPIKQKTVPFCLKVDTR